MSIHEYYQHSTTKIIDENNSVTNIIGTYLCLYKTVILFYTFVTSIALRG